MKSKILNSLSCISRNRTQSKQEITEQQVPQIRQIHNDIDVNPVTNFRFSKFNLIPLEEAKQKQHNGGNYSCEHKRETTSLMLEYNTQPQIQSITNDTLREARLNLKKLHPEERIDLSSYNNVYDIDNNNPQPSTLSVLYNDMVQLIQELNLLGQD